jgi:hypothetical protein
VRVVSPLTATYCAICAGYLWCTVTIKIVKTSTSNNSNNNGSGWTVQTKHPSSPGTSPHPKRNKTSGSFFTPNRYEVLKDDAEFSESIEMTTESTPQLPPPPPIFITSTIDYTEFCKQIKSISGDEGFVCKSTSKNLKLSLYSSNSFHQTIKLLNDSSIEYHTNQAKEYKPYRVVLKNLHHSIPTDYISQELTELGFSVRNVTNIKKRQSNDPLSLFFIDLNPEIKNPDIFKFETLCYSKIKIEESHTRRDFPQCHRCQNYGHTRSYCNRKPRCVRCGQDHLSDMCEKSKDLLATCALCGEGHPSNYKGCMVHKKLQKSRTTKIADQRLTKPSITDATNPISNQPNNFVQDSSSSSQNLTGKSLSNTNHRPRTYSDVSKSSIPQNVHPTTPETPLSTQLSSFLENFQTLITLFISFLTTLINKIISTK